ncbi:hypothetical protein C4F40_02940 [Sphingobacterium sp. Ka21]|uniref:Uncharacterized protein n=1 Tax=Sphingobacterium pedocola TaxID=2082722 RepID=A0ABR9T2V8_9SPHI|nr:hypothetical protein [Sphingobacterium pedocola]
MMVHQASIFSLYTVVQTYKKCFVFTNSVSEKQQLGYTLPCNDPSSTVGAGVVTTKKKPLSLSRPAF